MICKFGYFRSKIQHLWLLYLKITMVYRHTFVIFWKLISNLHYNDLQILLFSFKNQGYFWHIYIGFFLLGWRLFLYSWGNKIFRIYSIGCYSGIQLLKKYSMAFYSFCIKYSFVFTRFPQITRSWFTCFFKKLRVTRFILVFT